MAYISSSAYHPVSKSSSSSSSSSSAAKTKASYAVDVDHTKVLGYRASEWVVPSVLLCLTSGVASVFSPSVGGVLGLLGICSSIAMCKAFLKTVERISDKL